MYEIKEVKKRHCIVCSCSITMHMTTCGLWSVCIDFCNNNNALKKARFSGWQENFHWLDLILSIDLILFPYLITFSYPQFHINSSKNLIKQSSYLSKYKVRCTCIWNWRRSSSVDGRTKNSVHLNLENTNNYHYHYHHHHLFVWRNKRIFCFFNRIELKPQSCCSFRSLHQWAEMRWMQPIKSGSSWSSLLSNNVGI